MRETWNNSIYPPWWTGLDRTWDTFWAKTCNMSSIILNQKSFGQKKKISKSMHRGKSAKMTIWLKTSHFAILALLSLCIDFKIYFGQITFGWVLWKTYCKFLLKKFFSPCPALYMSSSRRIRWIILSFPHRISKILFVLSSWDDSWSLGYKIGTNPFFWYLNFWKML